MTSRKYIGFIDLLEDDDYGIIIGSDGEIKGLWVPKDYDYDDIPEPIVDFCVKHFGINPNEPDDSNDVDDE